MAPGTQLFHRSKRALMHLRRRLYGLRALVPGLRERHRFEAMVGPLGFWDELQRYQLHVLCANGLKPDHSLLDLGCGPLQGGVAFIRYLDKNRYTGIDLEPTRIQAAHAQVARLSLAAKNPQLFVSSSFGKEELHDRAFDFIWASQILYYFNDIVMGTLLDMIRQRLNPGGRFLGDIFSPDHYEFRYPENPGRYIRHTPESLQLLAAQKRLQTRCLGPIVNFQYPKRLYLRSNLLIEITRPAP